MKLVYLSTSLMWAVTLVVSSPSRLDLRQEDGVPEGYTIQPLVFTGRIEADGPNVTLSGDAQSIYNQILELNPNYDPTVFPEYIANQQIAADAMARKRSDAGALFKRDRIECGHGERISQSDLACPPQLRMLNNIQGLCEVGARACARTACGNQCGVWLCNDNTFPVGVWCPNIAGDGLDIANECTWRDDLGIVSTLHGRIWRDLGHGWNVQVSRCTL
ncbi:hypothetical protein QBC34DRAFT_381361 [Podospora aff. communis PSN243]|uniref:Secreted protein n=1 Tax=Podospora aff. communis PSN243 TaxID=3040156 RepID=A0AAV9GJ02_9PEZI|nr:hypothetical protein QBC34DRAFT_381361 [Podospora aff. communis PSN243]